MTVPPDPPPLRRAPDRTRSVVAILGLVVVALGGVVVGLLILAARQDGRDDKRDVQISKLAGLVQVNTETAARAEAAAISAGSVARSAEQVAQKLREDFTAIIAEARAAQADPANQAAIERSRRRLIIACESVSNLCPPEPPSPPPSTTTAPPSTVPGDRED